MLHAKAHIPSHIWSELVEEKDYKHVGHISSDLRDMVQHYVEDPY